MLTTVLKNLFYLLRLRFVGNAESP